MVYRLLTCGIVLFWLVMMGLLVRRDVYKAEVDALSFPPEHILRLMFLHTQDSNLEIQQDGESVGALSLKPTVRAITDSKRAYNLQISGNIMVLAGIDNQHVRITAETFLDLSPSLELERVRARTGVRERDIEATIQFNRLDNQLKFQVRQHEQALRSWEGRPEDLQNLPELNESGFSVGQLETLKSQLGTPQIRGTRGSVFMKGEEVETYLIQVQHAEGMTSSIYFSQLGQVLKVELFTGQVMLSEGVDP